MLARLIDWQSALRPLGCFVGYFFLDWFPGGFIAYKKRPWCNLFLTGYNAKCVTVWHLGTGKYWFVITHIFDSLMVLLQRRDFSKSDYPSPVNCRNYTI